MDDILIANGSVKSIMQGETLTLTAGIPGGGYISEEPEEYEVTLRICSKTDELHFSTCERAGYERIGWTDGGVLLIAIPGERTREMLGRYSIECKITKCGQTIVSDRSPAFEVVESRIGSIKNE